MDDIMHNNKGDFDAFEEHEKLGRRLREAREYVGFSQEAVAEQLGIPRASISAIETGKRKVSSVELKHFAKLYSCSIASLLGENTQGQAEQADDPTVRALFRTTRELSEHDRQQVLRFAQFLRHQAPEKTQE